jgi:uncharacterized protein (DUF1501 family)
MTYKASTKLNPDQVFDLKPLFDHLHQLTQQGHDAAIIAQIYPDGLIARVVTGGDITAIQKITGAQPEKTHTTLSERMEERSAA